MNRRKLRAAIYCRVSTVTQIDGYSLDEQERFCTEYCNNHQFKIINTYIEKGESGKNTYRTELKKLLKSIKNKEIDVVVVYKLDRLSRKLRDVIELVEDEFDKNEINLISTSEGFDLKTPSGRLMLYMLASFAENERKTIVERSRMGHIAKAEAGLSNGGTYICTGYDTVNGRFVINKKEAEIVKLIFNMFLDGYNYTQISKYLTDKLGRFWHNTTIKNIITNRFYIGEMKYAKKVYKGDYETFIEKSIFDKAQIKAKQISQGYNSRSRSKFATLTSGYVYCAKCGAKYYTSGAVSNKDGTKRIYMYCYRKNKAYRQYQIDGVTCDNVGLRAERLNRIVLDEMLKLNITPALIKNENKKNNEKEILENQIKSNEAKLEKLIELFANDSIPIEILNKKIEAVQSELTKLKINLDDLEQDTTLLDRKEAIDFINREDIIEIIKGDDQELQRPILEYLINRIEIEDENVIIHWNFE